MPDRIAQAAAIPLRVGQVCLVTSTSGKRWVIPKGIIDPGRTPQETALQEAWEEAGLTGVVGQEPVGHYQRSKWGAICQVSVFVMQVTAALDDWPERALRRRCWLAPAQALASITENDLRIIMQKVLQSGRCQE